MEGATVLSNRAERALDLRTLMDDLLKDRRISSDDHLQVLNSSRSKEEASMHPLSYIAQQNLVDEAKPGNR